MIGGTETRRIAEGPPIAVDLYSGAGGLSEGFLDAGFDVHLAVDNDRWACETQRANHASRGVEVLTADLDSPTTLKAVAEKVAAFGRPLTLLIGAPPCQGFSRSNVRTRTRGNPQNQHIYTFLRYVRRLRPPFVLLENVAGMETFDGGGLPREIVRLLERAGYHADVAVLNAADFGVPQKRHRIFFLANRVGVVNYFPSARLAPESWTTVWEAIGDLPSLPNGCAGGPLPYSAWRPSSYAQRMRKNASTHVDGTWVSKSTPLIVARYRRIPQGGNWRDIPDRLMRNYADKSRCHQWIYRRLAADEPAVVITNYRKSMLIHPYDHRGLSVREASRLQSFPDNFTFKGGILYQQQQVANAVPPLLARAVASTILSKMIWTATPLSALAHMAPDLVAKGRGQRRSYGRPPADTVRYFRSRLSRWASTSLRELPWRKTSDPFRILVAEVLLQKTTAAQVVEPWREIVGRYPSPEAMARADLRWLRDVVAPIGLPARAARLKAAAQTLVREYGGMVPRERKDLASLPGLGPYAAAAVACFAFGQPVPLVDSNIIRILGRFFGLSSPAARPRSDPRVWRFAATLVPKNSPGSYHRALIDLGGLICTARKPKCGICPLKARCAFPNSR